MIYFATINILLSSSSSTFCYQFYNYYCKINDFTNNNNRHCLCYFFHTLFCFLRLRREALKIKAVIICTTIADSFAEGDSKNDEIIPELLSEWFITFCHEITEKEDLHKWVAMSYFNSLNYHRYLCYFPPPVMSVTCSLLVLPSITTSMLLCLALAVIVGIVVVVVVVAFRI